MMRKIRKEKVKIAPKNAETWLRIFNDWSDMMDELYGKKTDARHDATEWDKNPAEWMEPYDNDVFFAWSENDGGAPISRSWKNMKARGLVKDLKVIDDE